MKKVLYVVIGIVVVYLLLALIGPKEVKVERQIAINQTSAMVKEKLGDFKFFHDVWSPWSELDPNMVCEYAGDPGERGHHYAWSGNKDVGKGEMTLMGFSGDSLLQTLSFEGEGDAKTYYIIKDAGTSTEVTWGMVFNIGFLQRTPMLFMNMDKMVGADYEKGLAKLKSALEGMKDESATADYQVEELNWEEKNFVGTAKVKMGVAEMGKFFGENYQKLGADLGKSKLQPEMAPSAIYFNWDEKTMVGELAAVMCLPKGAKLKGWESHTIPASKVLKVAYYGAYEKVGAAHMAIGKYMGEKGYTQGLAIEEYVTDPMAEKDTTKWLTNVYYTLK